MQDECAVLYCHLWSVLLYNIFPHYVINGTIFENKVIAHKIHVLIFRKYCTFCATFPITRRPDHNCTFWSSLQHRNSCHISLKLKFSRWNFRKYTNTKFHENPLSGGRIVPSGHTDRRTDITKVIIAFRDFVKAPKCLTTKFIENIISMHVQLCLHV